MNRLLQRETTVQTSTLLTDANGLEELISYTRRLHDARHTAATVLLLLGVAERTVMGVMGWSNTAMAARYQHRGRLNSEALADLPREGLIDCL
jgi:integrase